METTLGSSDVAALADISYRQLDYLARLLHFTGGSGHRRRWTVDQLNRLAIANLLAQAVPSPTSAFPAVAEMLLDRSDPPPPAGWAWLTGAPIDAGYLSSGVEALEQIAAAGGGVLIPYDLYELYGDRSDDLLVDLVPA